MVDVLAVESDWICDRTVIGRVREWAAVQLDPFVDPTMTARADDAVLCVSELVSNAVNAGSATVTLSLELRDDTLLVSLTDHAAGWPTVRPRSATESHGRGLVIVAALGREWGAAPLGTRKVVWVALDW